MMNKKIASEFAVGIILLVAIAIVSVVYFQDNPQNYKAENSATQTSQGNAPALFRIGATEFVKAQTIGGAGGEVIIENSQTPLDGFIISFHPGTFDEDVEVSIGYNDGSFESLPAGIPTGKTVVINAKSAAKLKYPIQISYSSDSRPIMAFAINSDGRLQAVDSSAFEPLVKSHTFNSETMITWIYMDSE